MSSRKIEDLSPVFQQMVKELLSKGQEVISDTGYTFFITDGFRSVDEQNKLYAQGRTTAGAIVTNARGGESAHNYGLAVDLAFQKDGKLFYTASLYNKVYPIAKTLGFVLGKDWSDFPDKPHFEYPNWRQAITKPQGGTMANMYKGYDLSNADSMKVAVGILVRVQAGEFVDSAKYKTDVELATNQGYQNGLEAGKALGGTGIVVDMSKWEPNGLLVEEVVGTKTITTNYKLK